MHRLLGNVYARARRIYLEGGRRKLEKAGRLSIGRHTYGSPRLLTFRNDDTSLTIGSFCSIGPDVTFVLGGNHATDRVTTFPIAERFGLPNRTPGFPESKGSITVGDDVWIGFGATILSGVTIGHGSVIAAGAIVNRDVLPFAIVAGIPAKTVGYRFSEETQRAVIASQWWTLSDEQIVKAIDTLNGSPAEAIIEELRGEPKH